jgi:hypothetical protein
MATHKQAGVSILIPDKVDFYKENYKPLKKSAEGAHGLVEST